MGQVESGIRKRRYQVISRRRRAVVRAKMR